MLDSVSPTVIATLVGAVLVYHLIARGLVAGWAKPLAEQTRASERAKARIADLPPFKDASDKPNAHIRIYREEGVSARPIVTFLAAIFALFALSLAAISLVMWEFEGPLAQTIWWVGPAFIMARMGINIIRSARKHDVSGAGLVVALFIAGGFGCGFALVYAFLPLGTMVFLVLNTLIGQTLWRLFPSRNDELPPVAMIFL